MKSEVKILLLGFSPFEKATFESFFKLVGRRETTYRIVLDLLQVQVLIVNSDNASALNWAESNVSQAHKVLYIGSSDPTGKWPAAPRPIKLTTVLGLLDVLTLANKPATQPLPQQEIVIATATKPTGEHFKSALVPPAVNSVREGSGGNYVSDFSSLNFLGLGKEAEPKSTARKFDDILVVDDSDIALKFMQNRLTRYGFRTELVKSGEAALTKIALESYKFVFLDVMMEGLDGYQTCRAIKQRKYTSGKAPVVVMLTSRGGSIDKIRGGLAGCDAYMTKPLNEAELLKVLSKYDEQVELSFRDTKILSSGARSIS